MKPEQSPSEESVMLDWESAPEGFREQYEKVVSETKAERESRKALEEKLASFERRETFERVLKEVGELDVSLEDLGPVKAEEITATLLKVKAQEKSESKQAALAGQAKALGFENVEEYEVTLKRIKEEREKEREDLKASAATASAGSGQPPAQPTGEEKHWEKVKESKKKGGSRATQAEALIESKFEEALEEAQKARGG